MKYIMIVMKKECKDVLRDRRSLITNFLLPMLLLPIILFIMSGSLRTVSGEGVRLAVALGSQCDTPEARAFVEEELLRGAGRIVSEEEADLLVLIDPDFADKIAASEPFGIEIRYDSNQEAGTVGMQVLGGAVEDYNRRAASEKLAQMGIDEKKLYPALMRATDITEGNAQGAFNVAGMMLPMLIAMLISIGGIAVSGDLIAGERDRFTLEPLLATRARRMAILAGKYATATIFSIMSVLSTILGLVLLGVLSPETMEVLRFSMDGGLPAGAAILVFLITVALGMTFVGIQLTLSTLARSTKEAQTYLSFLTFVVMIPSYVTMMWSAGDMQLWYFFVPILNTICSMKMVLGGIYNYTYLIVAAASSAVFVFIALRVCVMVFNNEKALFRS